MKIPFIPILSPLITAMPLLIAAQASLSGTLNTYHPVTSLCGSSCVNVSGTSGIAPGDLTLIIQMQGASANLGNAVGYGTITAYNGAGAYEFARVVSVSGSSVTLDHALANAYQPGAGAVQLVTVPEYPSAVVAGTVTAQAWNGSSGGVVALKVDGPLDLAADINATGQGFRGGSRSCNSNNATTAYVQSSCVTGYKGEGLVSGQYGLVNAQGALAGGGGGAHWHNAGGGGGGSCGAGGTGKHTSGYFGGPGLPGLGGQAFDFAAGTRLFLGGGGGGSHQNESSGSHGARGGGIVILAAAQINGLGGRIIANGANSTPFPNAVASDGGGGAGGAGTILVQSGVVSGAVQVSAKGGDSHYACCSTGDLYHGAGGGGGGGFIWHSGSTLPVGMSVDISGGDGSRNAFEGAAGCVQPGLHIEALETDPCANSTLSVSAMSSTSTVFPAYPDSSCATLTAAASGGVPPYSYAWSNGATAPSTLACPSSTTAYTVTITDANGCSATASVTVCVMSIHCKGHKLSVCHLPPGNPGNMQSLCLPLAAIPAHLAHGDYLGACGARSDCATASTAKVPAPSNFIQIFPNPSNGAATAQVDLDQEGTLQVFAGDGRMLLALPVPAGGATLTLDASLPAGLYWVRIENAHGFAKVVKWMKSE